jgi:hypothetical protein
MAIRTLNHSSNYEVSRAALGEGAREERAGRPRVAAASAVDAGH